MPWDLRKLTLIICINAALDVSVVCDFWYKSCCQMAIQGKHFTVLTPVLYSGVQVSNNIALRGGAAVEEG